MADMMLGYSKDPTLQEYSAFDFGFQEDFNSAPTTFEAYKQTGWGAYNPDAQASLYPPARTVPSIRGPRNAQALEGRPNGGHAQFAPEESTIVDDSKKPKLEGRKSFNLKKLVRGRSKSKAHRTTGTSEAEGASVFALGHQEHQSMSLPQEHSSLMSLAHPEAHSFQQSSIPSHGFHMDSADFYGSMHHQQDGLSHSHMDPSYGIGSGAEQYPDFNTALLPTTGWVNNLGEIDFSEILQEPVPRLQHGSPLTSRSVRGSRTFPMGVHSVERDRSTSRPLHSEMSRSKLRNHGSTQTLNSNVSSFGDSNSNSIMTPSDAGPTLPWLASEYDSRRASDSSELAHNVEGMHLQYAPPNLTIVNSNLVPSPHSSAVSINGPMTPDTSPDQLVEKPFLYQADLASRRQRSRPPALRPESGRSFSHNDPLSHSPHSRSSSVGLAAAGQPRRIQSSAQSLNSQFRVHKLNPTPAQISPRNIQAHIDKQAAASQRRSAANSGNASPTTFQMSNRPSASAASASRSQADYQHEFHIRSASSGQENNAMYHMPRQANASVPNLHSTVAQGPPQLSIQVPKQYNQNTYHHGQPQSAPPNKTSFFDDSPVNIHGPFAPPHSQPHQYTQAQLNQMTVGSAAVPQSVPLAGHGPIGPLPPFAPQYLFPENSTSGGYPSQGLLTSYPPQAQPPQPPAELDIKVEIGPSPKLASTFEKCEFQHTFSDAFPHNSDRK